MQKLSLIGTVGTVRRNTLKDGKPVVNVSLAVQEGFKKADGTFENKTNWFDLAYYTDKPLNYLEVGAKIAVDGIPKIKPYTDRNGVNQNVFSVTVQYMELISEPTSKTIKRHMNTLQEGTPVSQVQQYQSAQTDFVTDDGQPLNNIDIPF
jgi:single stranded DNA-binding protein